jgi:hypothetical protein
MILLDTRLGRSHGLHKPTTGNPRSPSNDFQLKVTLDEAHLVEDRREVGDFERRKACPE